MLRLLRKRYRAELNSRVIRIGLDDYILLTEMSRRADISMAEALHRALEGQGVETKVSLAEMPMPGGVGTVVGK